MFLLRFKVQGYLGLVRGLPTVPGCWSPEANEATFKLRLPTNTPGVQGYEAFEVTLGLHLPTSIPGLQSSKATEATLKSPLPTSIVDSDISN